MIIIIINLFITLQAATNEDLNMLLSLLECPILKSIATLHDSISILSTQVTQHPSILPNDFDITLAGKKIVFFIKEIDQVPCLGDKIIKNNI